jgi:hypothetical protein
MMRPEALVPAALALLSSVASLAQADPVTPVSFSWSVAGRTQAGASVACVVSPLPEDCEPMTGCSAQPADTFSAGGLILESRPTETYTAMRQCGSACTCCTEGASGQGGSQARVSVTVSSSEASTSWFIGARLDDYAAASSPESQPDCVVGSGSAAASASQLWTLVFDTEGTSLSFSRQHVVQVLGSGSSAESRITLTRDSVTVFTQTLSRSTEGQDDGSGTIEMILPAGRYTLTISSQIGTTASAPPNGGGGSIGVDAFVTLTFTPIPMSVDPNLEATALSFLGHVPEPFTARTTLRFALKEPAHVSLTIFDATGARVATVFDQVALAGEHAVSWDGRGRSGAPVPSGVYFASLVSGGWTSTRRLTLSR